jgi:hypothetical protein
MSDYATTDAGFDVDPGYAEPGYASPADGGEEMPSWAQGLSDRLGTWEQAAQQAEYEQALAEQQWQEQQYLAELNELYESGDEQAAAGAFAEYVNRAVSQHVAPYAEVVEQAQYEAALDSAQDFADEVLVDAGVEDSDEALGAALEIAHPLFEQRSGEFWRQNQHVYAHLHNTQGPEAAAQWLAETGEQLAVATLREAAAIHKMGDSARDEQGVMRRWFGQPSPKTSLELTHIQKLAKQV